MKERLNVIYDRLLRAQEHLETIKGDLIAYFDTGFSDGGGEFDPNGNGPFKPVFNIRGKVRDPELRTLTLIGEFLHDLRSSLDHLAWQMVEEHGGTPNENTGFPILKVPPTANSQGVHPPPNIIGGVSPAALALVEEAQPYKLGPLYAEHPLFVLHALWNIDKHRHVAIRGVRSEEFQIPFFAPKFTFTVVRGDFDENGTELILLPDDPAVQVDIRVPMRVMVHESGPGIERHLFEALSQAFTAVATTVVWADDECF